MGLRGPLAAPKPLPQQAATPPKAPPKPKGLSAEAGKHWKRLVPILMELGVLREADQDSLATLCKTLALQDAAQAAIDSPDFEIGSDKAGRVYRVWKGATEMIAKLSGRFGLDPEGRARLKVDAPAQTAAGNRVVSDGIEAALGNAPLYKRTEERPN